MFMHICLHLDDVIIPCESHNQADIVAQSFFDSKLQDESSGVLMDFLAFMIQKLWQNSRINYGNPLKLISMFLNKLGSSGHTFVTRTPGKFIKGSKDSYLSLESNQILSHNFGSFFSVSGIQSAALLF